MNININVKERVATAEEGSFVVCGNNDYTYTFTFDSSDPWDSAVVKTARFKYNGTYTDVAFTGNSCTGPEISNTTLLQVGVYSGNIRTSTPAVIPCFKSIRCGGTPTPTPSTDVYQQLLAMIDQIQAQVHTPVRGVDYWTASDIAAIKGYVDDAILNGEW